MKVILPMETVLKYAIYAIQNDRPKAALDLLNNALKSLEESRKKSEQEDEE